MEYWQVETVHRSHEFWFRTLKLLCLSVGIFFLASGCRPSELEVSLVSASSAQETPVPAPKPTPQTYVTYVTVLAEIEPPSNVQIKTSSPRPSFSQCHQEEMVGFPTCLNQEPELIEDPLFADHCDDSVNPWCDPRYEEEYLAYLDQARQQELHASIAPNFTAPVEDGLILRGMKAPGKKSRGHYGLDIIPRTWNPKGVAIKAVEDGIVVKAAAARGYGYYTIIYHQNGLFSLYSHTLKRHRAQAGQTVRRGETIAYMGKSGNARGYHLHFELIDLREHWPFEEPLDEFVRALSEGESLPTQQCNRLSQLLFAKQCKHDPAPRIPGLALAKRVNGKWVAATPPSQTTIETHRTN